MPITDYKMIYENRVYNVISITPSIDGTPEIVDVEVIYIDEDNNLQIVIDRVDKFKFIRR